MKKILFSTLCFFLALIAFGQKNIPNLNQLDALNYDFQIAISDSSNEIHGTAQVGLQFLKDQQEFRLDFVKKRADGKGMEVISIQENGINISFEQSVEQLSIRPEKSIKKGSIHTYTIQYQGIPADGLIIDKNIHGDRTFFGDNWPNRAHHWLPCVDHPSDKASVDFTIIAPDHYQIVANGVLQEIVNLDDERTLTHWRETVPIPMKVAVFGAARFGVQHIGEVNDIPISSWIYRQDRAAGYYDYRMAKEILAFFIKNIGPYPYKKLANVQSKTRYGGMENASNIFYFEQSVTGERKHESLIAHEIAHQWFGNSASEKNWHHVWLSEGFATYGTNLYLEANHGRDRMTNNLQSERQTIYTFANKKVAPVVDESVTDWNKLLNPNVYQRGSFVLHMLRREVGEAAFWKGLRQYYAQFAGRNALTRDFQKIMEKASGKNLTSFFQQWLYRAELPRMEVTWDKPKKNRLRLIIKQTQNGLPFDFPLDIQAIGADVRTTKKWTTRIKEKETEVILKCKFMPDKVILDPDTWLLFTAKITKK